MALYVGISNGRRDSVTRYASIFLKRPSFLWASFGDSIKFKESVVALIIHSQ